MTQLEPWALAAGLGIAAALAPWATVLILGALAALSQGVAEVPGDLQGLGSAWVLIPTLALAIVAMLVHTRLLAWGVWELLHIPVRLVLPPLLLLLALSGPPGGPRADPPELGGAVLLTLAASVLVVLLRWGWTISCEAMGRRAPHESVRGAALLALVAAGLTLALVLQPVPTGAVVVVLAGAAVFSSGPALRVAPMAPRLVQGLATALGGQAGWQVGSGLPRWLRDGGQDGWNPGPDVRGTPAILSPEGGDGELRAGWLVVRRGAPTFLFRSPARVWEVDLAEAVPWWDGTEADGPPSRLLQRIRLVHQDRRVILATSRGGPPTDRLRSEFGSGSGVTNL